MAQKRNLQRVSISFSASGNTTLVPALTVPANSGMRQPFMNIWEVVLVVAGATNLTFQDGAVNGVTGAMAMSANGSAYFGETTDPHFIISPGNDFVLNSSQAVQISGYVVYSA